MSIKKRILSGMRPTGKLHWGNYFGALHNWIELQEKYECFYFVADWHALTTGYEHTKEIAPSIIDVLKDWLAAGIDPTKADIFIQSWVPEHAELHLLLSMIAPLGWLERVPSYKDMQMQMPDRDLNMYGFLGYPLLQSADILMYKANYVPVGDDQLAHLEFTREIVRRFSFITGTNIFFEPEALLTKSARVPGTDGRKMSKSFNNAIFIADDDETVRKKMMTTITDPARKLRSDPGNPDVCNIFAYHKIYSAAEDVKQIAADCRSAKIGCVDCKKMCIERALKFWQPIREKRNSWDGKESQLLDIAAAGSKKAKEVAEKTMTEVRKALGLIYK